MFLQDAVFGGETVEGPEGKRGERERAVSVREVV